MPDWRADFAQFHKIIAENYAYWPDAPCDWAKVPKVYAADLDAVSGRDDFVRLLENAIAELCDHHAALGTNLASSYRLVPTGTDLWVEPTGGAWTVTDVRPGSDAVRKGIALGARIMKVGGVAVDAALAEPWPRTVPRTSRVARRFVANVLVAGRHDRPRTVQVGGRSISLAEPETRGGPVTARRIDGVGYVRIDNSLGDTATIAAFDAAMAGLRGARGVVLDLRETPSGGNTTVARAILGWFVNRDRPYQRHDDPSELKAYGVRRFWTEGVAPRPGKAFRGGVAVLVDRWTGSMGEGIAIALQGMGRARLFGGPMAGLKGAISRWSLDTSGIAFFFPTERVFRIDGMPRERCLPDRRVGYDLSDKPLAKSVEWLISRY